MQRWAVALLQLAAARLALCQGALLERPAATQSTQPLPYPAMWLQRVRWDAESSSFLVTMTVGCKLRDL